MVSLRWLWWATPLGLVIVGNLLLVAGFSYDMAFVGIPYPDPTPEQAVEYSRNSQIAGKIEMVGVLTIAAGLAALCVAAGGAAVRKFLWR